MNLSDEIISKASHANTKKIVAYIGADEERFAELMQLFMHGEWRMVQNSSWIVSKCAEEYPFLIKPYTSQLIEKLHEPNIHDSAKRNIIRLWQDVELPEEFWGEIYDICFEFLTSSTESIATRAFSMSVLVRIANKLPELKPELRMAIEDQMLKLNASPGILSRGKKVLKQLKGYNLTSKV